MSEAPLQVRLTGTWMITVALYASVAVNVGMGLACLWAGHQMWDKELALQRSQRLVVQMVKQYGKLDTVDAQLNWKKAELANVRAELAAIEK